VSGGQTPANDLSGKEIHKGTEIDKLGVESQISKIGDPSDIGDYGKTAFD